MIDVYTWATPNGHKVHIMVALLDYRVEKQIVFAQRAKLGLFFDMQGVATYRIAPKEELQNGDRAKVWFEKANVDGVVAVRPVSSEKRTSYTSGTWTSPYYSTLWGYYGYGWGSVYIPGSSEDNTFVVVESTIYSVPRNELLWAAVSETKDPKNLQRFIEDLVKASVKEMQKQGLAKNQPK